MIWNSIALSMMLAATVIGDDAGLTQAEPEYPLITDVGPCKEQPFYCLGGEIPDDLYATLIDLRGNQCTAITGDHSTTDFGNGQGPGTRLMKMECKDPDSYIVAVLAKNKGSVTDFEWLKAEKIEDFKQIHNFAKLLMCADEYSLDQANFLYSDKPNIQVLRHPHPFSEFYSVEFNSCPGPLYLIGINKIAGGWTAGSYEGETRYFRLNHRYYIETCAGHCESDCGPNYIDVFAVLEKANKPQLQKK